MAELERFRPVTEYQQTPGGFVKVAEMHPDQEAGRYVHISDLREALTSKRAVEAIRSRLSTTEPWARQAAEALVEALADELLGGDDG